MGNKNSDENEKVHRKLSLISKYGFVSQGSSKEELY